MRTLAVMGWCYGGHAFCPYLPSCPNPIITPAAPFTIRETRTTMIYTTIICYEQHTEFATDVMNVTSPIPPLTPQSQIIDVKQVKSIIAIQSSYS
ncbi:hypothetical protein FVER14953_21156 [Fusarium verticillioides]|nr:hypothetical protein FVER14953_21156 [Fusarium verticillioides]